MANDKKTVEGKAIDITGTKDKDKATFLERVKKFPENHPKITKAAKVTWNVVSIGSTILCAVAGVSAVRSQQRTTYTAPKKVDRPDPNVKDVIEMNHDDFVRACEEQGIEVKEF